MRSFITLLAPVVAIAHSLVAQEQQPAAAAPKPSPVREVIVIIKTHFDIGYTHRVREIVHHYRTDMIDKAMDIMRQERGKHFDPDVLDCFLQINNKFREIALAFADHDEERQMLQESGV